MSNNQEPSRGGIAEWMRKINSRINRIERGLIRRPGEGGAYSPRRFASKAALDLWAPADGTPAWVTADNREYVRISGSWQVGGTETFNFTNQLAVGGTLWGYRQGRMVELVYSSGNYSVPAGNTNLMTMPEGFRPSNVTAREGNTNRAPIRLMVTGSYALTLSNPGAAQQFTIGNIMYFAE